MPMSMKDLTHVVYVLRAADNWPLYVGITNNLERRLGQHLRTKPWWGDVAKATVTPYPDLHHAFWAERITIGLECPEHNIAPGNCALPLPRSGHRREFCRFCLHLRGEERRLESFLAAVAADARAHEQAIEAARAAAGDVR